MFLYTCIVAIASAVAGMLIAVRSKKVDGVVYGRLDKAGRITNILLLIVYLCLSPLYLILGMLSRPDYDGFLGLLGWIVSIIIASAAPFCSLGLGFSIVLRKKGRSKLSFALQFAGVVGIGLTVGLFLIFYGNLLRPLN